MSSSAIKQILQTNAVWQASQKSSPRRALSTGYSELDQQLHCAGWPQAALSELLLSQPGIGELRLLTPLLRQLNKQIGYIAWINPPYLPYPPALLKQQLLLQKMLIIDAKNSQDSIWAAQQAMASQSCSAVLLWLPDKTLDKEIRKLSLAAKTGNCWGIIFRSRVLQQQASAATLRMVMQVNQQRQQLSIIKQPGGWSGQQVCLNLFPERQHWGPQAVNHWPTFETYKTSSKLLTPTSEQHPQHSCPIQIPSYH